MTAGPWRIAHVITEARPMGGAQLNTFYSLRYQQARHNVALVAGNDGPLGYECRMGGIPVRIIEMSNRLFDPVRDVQSLVRLVLHFRRVRPDIVHTHSSKAGVVGRIAARLAGVPVVVHTVHGTPFYPGQALVRRLVTIWLEWVCAKLTDELVSVADTVSADFSQHRICSRDRIQTVVSGIDFRMFPHDLASARTRVRRELGIQPETQVIISVGHLREVKRHDMLVRVAAEIVHAGVPSLFLIVGEGELRDQLQAQIGSLGLDRQVRLCGQRRDVPELLAASDVFAQTSRHEGLSRSLVEAMYTGLPVVATDAGATREMVRDSDTGILVAVGDEEGFARGLLDLLVDRDRGRSMGDRARKLVAGTRSTDAMGAALESVYGRAIGYRGVHRSNGRSRQPEQGTGVDAN